MQIREKNILFSLLFVITSAFAYSHDEFAGGSGTAEDPWLIANAWHLDNVRNYIGEAHSDRHFKQIADIDLGIPPWNRGEGWIPIGHSMEMSFRGVYDGNGYTIKALYINRPAKSLQGLFGITRYANIRNLGLEDISINGQDVVGGLAAGTIKSVIENCYITGNVNGYDNVGGLIGSNNYSEFISSHSNGSVSGNNAIGGLTGFNQNSTIKNSYNTASVNGQYSVGGLAGHNYYSDIEESHSAGSVNGYGYVGGLTGSTYVASIEKSYNTGSVTGVYSVGGNAGRAGYSYVENSYSTGCVNGSNNVGGLIGETFQAYVINCYSTGYVVGQDFCSGGLIGKQLGYPGVYNSFWDIETSGQKTSDGGEGKTTKEMIIKETFKEWDFDAIWEIIEGETYPYLQWQEEPGGHNYPHRYEIILIVNPKEGGVVYGEGIYDKGELVEITAEAKQGWEFIEWTGDIKYADNPEQASATVIMPAEDITITANFKDVVYVKDIVEANVKVFPNPARNKIFIKSNELIKQIRLVNSSGQVVRNIAVDAHRAKLNVNNLTPGIYFVQAYSDKGVSAVKIKVFR